MHLFLQGLRRVGKSTVIQKTLDILTADSSFVIGGFYTWNGGPGDPRIYMRHAGYGKEGEIYQIAEWDAEKGGLISDIGVFEREGVRILNNRAVADLIIMDELGFLESRAEGFKRAVLETVAGDVPVFGVLRLGDVPWHTEIKCNPSVELCDVNESNRDDLPPILADRLRFLVNLSPKQPPPSGNMS